MIPPLSSEEREARILSLERQVRFLAARKHATVPFARIHFEEMLSAAWLGAIQAVDSYDETTGNSLSTYASWKIASAMADYLRSLDPLGRPHRRAVKRGEVAEIRTLSFDAPRRNKHDPYKEIGETHEHCMIDERAAREQSALEARLAYERIAERAELKPRSAKILTLWAAGGKMKEIGEGFNLKESRVSQICSEALLQLRLAA